MVTGTVPDSLLLDLDQREWLPHHYTNCPHHCTTWKCQTLANKLLLIRHIYNIPQILALLAGTYQGRWQKWVNDFQHSEVSNSVSCPASCCTVYSLWVFDKRHCVQQWNTGPALWASVLLRNSILFEQAVLSTWWSRLAASAQWEKRSPRTEVVKPMSCFYPAILIHMTLQHTPILAPSIPLGKNIWKYGGNLSCPIVLPTSGTHNHLQSYGRLVE